MERYNYHRLKKAIENVSIQGATNIAEAVLGGIVAFSDSYKGTDVVDYFATLKDESSKLATIRPTEPLSRNAAKYVLSFLNTLRSVEENKKILRDAADAYMKLLIDARERIIASALVLCKEQKVKRILTHCHSSTVIDIIIALAKEYSISVIATETRPKYQGHRTVHDLREHQIDVSMCVDLEAAYFIYHKQVDIVLVGNDEILEDGGFLNKVGTLGIVYMAKASSIPVYSAGTLLKYSAIDGRDANTELRNVHEVLREEVEGLKIINPAFDVVEKALVSGYITELGVLSGDEVAQKVVLRYPFICS